MSAALTIGEFSALTHLSVRTLRHYHQTGVLTPDSIDASSGYRYYTVEQIATAQIVHRLRELDLPLPEIKAIMATDDPGVRSEVIATHLQRLRSELDRTRAAVVALEHLLRPGDPELVVDVRSVPARTVAAVSDHVALDDILPWYDAAMAELEAVVPPDRRSGPPAGRYANALFSAEAGAAMVYYPVHEDPVPDPAPGSGPRGRVEILTLPAAELAVTTHRGPHDDIAETYGRLGTWVVEHALAIDEAIHETYVVGPRDTDDEGAWRTEIGWPIFRVARERPVVPPEQ